MTRTYHVTARHPYNPELTMTPTRSQAILRFWSAAFAVSGILCAIQLLQMFRGHRPDLPVFAIALITIGGYSKAFDDRLKALTELLGGDEEAAKEAMRSLGEMSRANK
jgi:hypothetical protein